MCVCDVRKRVCAIGRLTGISDNPNMSCSIQLDTLQSFSDCIYEKREPKSHQTGVIHVHYQKHRAPREVKWGIMDIIWLG